MNPSLCILLLTIALAEASVLRRDLDMNSPSFSSRRKRGWVDVEAKYENTNYENKSHNMNHVTNRDVKNVINGSGNHVSKRDAPFHIMEMEIGEGIPRSKRTIDYRHTRVEDNSINVSNTSFTNVGKIVIGNNNDVRK